MEMLDAPFAVQATLLAKENDALRAENERLEMLYRTQGEALDRENDALRARCEKVKNQPPDLTAGEFNRGE
jgi:deoxyribodipyrimidine photolyase-like uncharacterized protein